MTAMLGVASGPWAAFSQHSADCCPVSGGIPTLLGAGSSRDLEMFRLDYSHASNLETDTTTAYDSQIQLSFLFYILRHSLTA